MQQTEKLPKNCTSSVVTGGDGQAGMDGEVTAVNKSSIVDWAGAEPRVEGGDSQR